MEPHLFTDATGRRWHVYDFRSVERRRRRVPIGDWRSEARAFVPAGSDGPVLVYSFGPVAYRDDLRPRFLEDQLSFAKPLGASAADRMTAGQAGVSTCETGG
jgi:hypothetical protein